MHDTRNQSPFAAKTRKEQLEQWICWQNQHQDMTPVEAMDRPVPPLRLPGEEQPAVQQAAPPQPAQVRSQPRHSEYDAVISRMRNARRQASKDQSWSG